MPKENTDSQDLNTGENDGEKKKKKKRSQVLYTEKLLLGEEVGRTDGSEGGRETRRDAAACRGT